MANICHHAYCVTDGQRSAVHITLFNPLSCQSLSTESVENSVQKGLTKAWNRHKTDRYYDLTFF